MNQVINPIYLDKAKMAELRHAYETNPPCRHIIMDNFLVEEVASQMYSNFPPLDTLNVKRKSLNEQKSEDYHFDRFHPVFTKVREMIMSKEFAAWMVAVTGIENLYVTDDSLGSGVHQGGNGSYVDVHIDINVNAKANAWRRLNLLIYLNQNWQAEYGGDLELWNPEMTKMEVKYAPLFNRAIVFYTDENAPHGYRKMTLPEGVTRKSFYTYFYTPMEEGVAFRDSQFLARPDESPLKRMLTTVKEGLKITAKKVLYKLGVKSLDFQDKN
ncbi:MAG: 2OG-Fe(II) oxygenase [Bacteroidia bacterium]